MSIEHQKRILQILVDEANNPAVGLNVVKSAIHQFEKLGLKAIYKPTEERRAVPRNLVEKAWQRQKGLCSLCGEPVPLADAVGEHTDPHSLGGKMNAKNITAAHGGNSEVNCNGKKGGRDMLSESKRTGRLFNQMLPKED
jgi:hypothetical protein